MDPGHYRTPREYRAVEGGNHSNEGEAIKVKSGKTRDLARNAAEKLGWKSRSSSSESGPSDLQEWHAKKHHELNLYQEKRTAANYLAEPDRALASRDARARWSEFLAGRPGCDKDPQCSARTPCGYSRCNYK